MMKLLLAALFSILLFTRCGEDDSAVLGSWSTDALSVNKVSGNEIYEARFKVAQSTEGEYIMIVDFDRDIYTFVSTSESEGVIYIESIDDELNWAYSGEVRMLGEELQLTYQYRDSEGAELPPFNGEGLFVKD